MSVPPSFSTLPSSLSDALTRNPRRWLVTGAAGFIGSHLVETLLEHGQEVTGLDNFVTGKRSNLDQVEATVGPEAWARFRFIEGDIRDVETCERVADGQDVVLHQAALGSVPWSIDDPLNSSAVNVQGALNMLDAARRAGVSRFIYAASSATYGDDATLPKVEDSIGAPLSPYALTKRINELQADLYGRVYGFRATGLRYFNVFGPRQDPDGPYAAVIPRWIAAMASGATVDLFGDGGATRDFCYVANVVQANLAAALAANDVQGAVYNIALGDQTSLLKLFEAIRGALADRGVDYALEPRRLPERDGDIRHSVANIDRARAALGYAPTVDLRAGLARTVDSIL